MPPPNTDILLILDHEHLGLAGEVARVRPGYARNYLVPYGLAWYLTDSVRKRLEEHQRTAAAKNNQWRRSRLSLAERMENETLVFHRRIKSGDHVYAPVKAHDILRTLKKTIPGISLQRRDIHLPGTGIDRVGMREVDVSISGALKVVLEVWVIPIYGRDLKELEGEFPMYSRVEFMLPPGEQFAQAGKRYRLLAELHRGSGTYSEEELPQSFEVALDGRGFEADERALLVTCEPGSKTGSAQFNISPTVRGTLNLSVDYFVKNHLISQRQLSIPVAGE